MVGGGLAGTFQYSARTEDAKLLIDVDPTKRPAVVSEALYDLEADPGERSPLPATEVSRFGDEFAAAVEEIRARASR
jgi:hypothetical protein